jgi:exonuclease 3'-5' domain-containing protein 1
LFKVEHGGSYESFNPHPIPDEIVSYCVGDVQYLPELWDRFHGNADGWRDLVNEETKKRVAASQKPDYQPDSPDRTLAPWSEDQNRILDERNWDDDGPTSCRDIIDDWDYEYYYSD